MKESANLRGVISVQEQANINLHNSNLDKERTEEPEAFIKLEAIQRELQGVESDLQNQQDEQSNLQNILGGRTKIKEGLEMQVSNLQRILDNLKEIMLKNKKIIKIMLVLFQKW
ncbi:hypothetical protein NX779_02115 [Mycoplasma cottewii]|uniref:Uncharacterized protein n=1 Tax=Mycoplasma cottewii TaxID=51364 RepID=A0ABY5TYY4_9MOLU|nr:hypothetical protein [Mycoplasma cottewii]UWD35410.1 hypothetical protein NX779_02115 [Mycoplasma cottewii]